MRRRAEGEIMLTLKLDFLLPLLDALRNRMTPNHEPPPPRELQRLLEEVRLAQERQKALALLHRLHGRS